MHVWGTHKMVGWKYWNKNKPTDATNRPHAMPLKSLSTTNKLSLSVADLRGVKTERTEEGGDPVTEQVSEDGVKRELKSEATR